MSADLPFSRPVKVETLPRDGLAQVIEASAEERAALARVNDLADLALFRANFLIKKSGKGVRVVGAIRAEVTQTCVVSMEPFAVTVDEPIDVKFAPEAAERAKPKTEAELLLDEDDDPDPIVDGKIDLGGLAAEFLTLALDPYPRKPGVEFTTPPVEDESSPFDALAPLAKKKP